MNRVNHLSVVITSGILSVIASLLLFPALGYAGGITGELRDENGNLIEEPIYVDAILVHEWNRHGNQSENGRYRIENIPEGRYWIETQGANPDTWHPRVYHPNRAYWEEADQIFVPANEIVEVNLTLLPGGRISGAVTPAEGGRFPERGIGLRCTLNMGDGGTIDHGIYTMDDPAAYQSTALIAGEYYVRFVPMGEEDLHVPNYCGDTWNPEEAEMVVIEPRQWNRNINASLPVGGGISGTIRGQAGLLPDARVTGYGPTGEWEHVWEGLWWDDQADQDGNYFIRGIPPDVDFYLRFRAQWGQNYVAGWYDDVYDREDGTPLRVRAGQILRGINAQLLPGIVLFGNIRGPDGSVPQNLDIKVHRSLGSLDDDRLTINPQQNGNWTTGSGLPPGIYTFEFEPSEYSYPYWQRTFVGGAIFPWQANWFKWRAGEQAGPFNMNLAWAGEVEGVVTDPDGNPVPEAWVWLFSGQRQAWDDGADYEGRFSFSNIPPGRYTMMADLDAGLDINHTWSATFYRNAGSFGQAESFAVNAQQTIQVNLQLLRGGVLHALVTDPRGGFYEQADNVMVLALLLDRNGERNIFGTSRDGPPAAGPEGFDVILPPGEFTLMGLPTYVGANQGGATPSVRRTFYGGGFDFEGAQFFQITPGQTTEIEMAMVETGRAVSGTVRSAVDDRITTQFMMTTDEQGDYSGIYYPSRVNQANTFFIQGLSAGQFYLVAIPFFGGGGNLGEGHLVTTWHPNQADPGGFPIFNFQRTPPPQGAQVLQMGNADLRGIDIVMQPVEHYASVGDDPGTPVAPPSGFELRGAYPNPFNDVTVITFALPTRAFVRLSIYNLLGRKVGEVLAEPLDAGSHQVPFSGGGLATGFYFIQMQSGGYEATAPLILMK